MLNRRRFSGALAATAATTLASPAIAQSRSDAMRSGSVGYRLVTLSRDLEQPWSIAFLPDGRLLITERPGRLRLFADGKLVARPIEGVPQVRAVGQGGLLDVCLHPDHAGNRVIYLSLAGPADGGALTRVVRARLGDGRLLEVAPIFDAMPAQSGGNHFGSRIAFDRAGLMYVTAGERYRMARAQDLGDLGGKVVRLRDDGSVPPDNPFVGRPGARPEIFTWGHRNPQGLAMHPQTGRMWLSEHGPRGGDELNLLEAGANYGWPLATHGIDYNGSKISDHRSLPGMRDPVRVWVPSISPCGLCFYTGETFGQWKGSLFSGALSSNALYRIRLEGEKWASEDKLLEGMLPYIRDVRQGPDGFLYLVTHADSGGLYRIEPA